MAKIHGGQILARALRHEGVDTVFALTGGHIMGFLDGCVLEGIRIVDVRHEQTAAHAAEAYTRLTGRLGVAAVTAGPGVTDAITGVATADASGTPMLLLGGRHLVRQELMGGLQEMDHPQLFRSITKWAGTGWQTERLAETVATAVRHAHTGRGGPVFLDVPMDLQLDQVEEDSVLFPADSRPNRPTGASPGVVAEIVDVLAAAERPMVFAGGGYRERTGEGWLDALATALGAPV
ncbi:MAG: thiamine pyrophosphate-binding protein, partial [Acidimicrobiia bacterium]